MRKPIRILAIMGATLFLSFQALSQASEICSEKAGSAWLSSKTVYGKVSLVGADDTSRPPKVTVTVLNPAARVTASTTIDRSGNYCFHDTDGSGATLIVEVEGREVGRDVLETASGNMPKQFRRDFQLEIGSRPSKPAVVSAKYPYQRTDQNSKLFLEAERAIASKDSKTAEQLLSQLVASDPADFFAWAKLGTVYYERSEMSDAEKAFQRSLSANPNFAPAMMNIGRIHLLQKRTDAAIEMLLKATTADPSSARSFQLLGEAYLVARKGTLGVEALNEAIRLEPIAMADSHLLMALLYDKAGAKNFASREYRMFLEKVPNHPDAKKFALYIKQNPDVP
jgi:Tfp pilus assembly protein PilF